MTLRKIAALVTCVAVICGAALLWPVYKRKATERKFAEAARVRAAQGDANAQVTLGKMYANGQGVRRDYTEAVRWLRKSADQGDAEAQYRLGVMYLLGHGVQKDNTEAIRWYRKAAGQGSAQGQYGLAYMYGRGQGVPQDNAQAVFWCRKAAEQGDATAQYALGLRYVDGEGVPPDYAEAAGWYRKAADQGDAKAQYVLGVMYYRGQGVPQDYTEAFRWFRKAADQGDGPARGILTVSYFKGKGVPRNYVEAIHWYGKLQASCFAKIERGPLARGTFVVGILLALPVLFMPRRSWGRGLWLPLALVSAVLAVAITHELSVLALRPRGVLGTLSSSPGRVLFIALIAGLSVLYAIGAVVEAIRRSNRGGRGTSTQTCSAPPEPL